MTLASKLDRIAARADELRDMLTQGLSGEAYVKASKELSDIEPVVTRIGDRGLAILHPPAAGGYVSLKASATDAAANRVEQTIIRAY